MASQAKCRSPTLKSSGAEQTALYSCAPPSSAILFERTCQRDGGLQQRRRRTPARRRAALPRRRQLLRKCTARVQCECPQAQLHQPLHMLRCRCPRFLAPSSLSAQLQTLALARCGGFRGQHQSAGGAQQLRVPRIGRVGKVTQLAQEGATGMEGVTAGQRGWVVVVGVGWGADWGGSSWQYRADQ